MGGAGKVTLENLVLKPQNIKPHGWFLEMYRMWDSAFPAPEKTFTAEHFYHTSQKAKHGIDRVRLVHGLAYQRIFKRLPYALHKRSYW